MKRIILLAVISLVFRGFAVSYSHCMDSMMKPVANADRESEMANCEEAMNSETSAQPCKHMKECFLDNTNEDVYFQKSLNASLMDEGAHYAFYVPALSLDLYLASSKARTYYQPPPDHPSSPSLYLAKSSFLI